MGKSARKKKAKAAPEQSAPETSPERRLNLDDMIRRMNAVSLSASIAAVGSEVPSETARSWTAVGSGSNTAGLMSARTTSPWEDIRSDMSSPEVVYTPSNDEDSLDRRPAASNPDQEEMESLRNEFSQKCEQSSGESKSSFALGQGSSKSSANTEVKSTAGTGKDQKGVKPG